MKDTLADRLRTAIADADTSMKRASLGAGLGETAARDIIYERSKQPRLSTIAALAKHLRKPMSYFEEAEDVKSGLITIQPDDDLKIIGIGPPLLVEGLIGGNSPCVDSALDDFALIGVYDATVSAGNGAINDPLQSPDSYHAYRIDWLRSVTSASYDKLAVIRVSGDSMWQTLHDGDHVLVDLTVNKFVKDSLYVLRFYEDEEIMVKRVSRDKGRTLLIKSDNPEYSPRHGVPDEEVQIIGRVIWLGRNIG